MSKCRRLITSDEATETKRQHVKPCSDCPFLRDSLPGWLGGGPPDEWVANAHGECRMDCHTRVGLDGRAWQCAGVAVYRANVGKRTRFPAFIMELPKAPEVFSSSAQFLAHHRAGDGQGGGEGVPS